METGGNAIFSTDPGYRINPTYGGLTGHAGLNGHGSQWNTSRSGYADGYQSNGYESAREASYHPSSAAFPRGATTSPFSLPPLANGISAIDTSFQQPAAFPHQYPRSPPLGGYNWQQRSSFAPNAYGPIGSTFNSSFANGDTGRNGHGPVRSHGPGSLLPEEDSGASLGQGLRESAAVLGSPTRTGLDAAGPPALPRQSSFSPTDSVDELTDISPRLSDASMDSNGSSAKECGRPFPVIESSAFRNNGSTLVGGRPDGRSRPPRRGNNRDEFDGPHQLLPVPTPEYIAKQERELPHLPTNLLVQEQDSVLSQVNDRLSQCAFDFVARYQFPIPLTQDMRPVERPQDREWTEWVQLLKRLATKRRIPARVLYNNQIKQLVTILENSLEMRHAARHQSRPLKDDRNILQLISAGIQVAKILKDATAMEYLNQLYVTTDRLVQERSVSSASARFRA